jgi:hypothetical protein
MVRDQQLQLRASSALGSTQRSANRAADNVNAIEDAPIDEEEEILNNITPLSAQPTAAPSSNR